MHEMCCAGQISFRYTRIAINKAQQGLIKSTSRPSDALSLEMHGRNWLTRPILIFQPGDIRDIDDCPGLDDAMGSYVSTGNTST